MFDGVVEQGGPRVANNCPRKYLHQGWMAEDAACKGRRGDRFLNSRFSVSRTMPLTAQVVSSKSALHSFHF